MSYIVTATDLTRIRLNEQDTVNSILQNVAVILNTRQGSIPLYRQFGLNTDFLDKPMPVAKVMMIAAVREAVERWEPRVTVVGVFFVEDLSQPGRLIPAVEVELKNE